MSPRVPGVTLVTTADVSYDTPCEAHTRLGAAPLAFTLGPARLTVKISPGRAHPQCVAQDCRISPPRVHFIILPADR